MTNVFHCKPVANNKPVANKEATAVSRPQPHVIVRYFLL
jgi:hypothetical protein